MPSIGDIVTVYSTSPLQFGDSGVNINSSLQFSSLNVANGVAFTSENGEGTGTVSLVLDNGVDTEVFDEFGQTTLVRVGQAAARSAQSSLLLHAESGLRMESVDYDADLMVFNLDFNCNIYVGCLETQPGVVGGRGASETGDLVLSVQSNQAYRVQYNNQEVYGVHNGRLQIATGGAIPQGFGPNAVAGAIPASPGGPIYDILTGVPTTSTAALALYNQAIAGNVFQNFGDTIEGEFPLTCTTNASNTREIIMYFGASATPATNTKVFDTGAVTTVTSGVCVLRYKFTYISSGTVQYTITPIFPGAGTPQYPVSGTVTGLTLSSPLYLSVTGQANTAGTVTLNPCKAIEWKPAAVTYSTIQALAPLFFHTSDIDVYQLGSKQTPCTTSGQSVQLIGDQSGNGFHLWGSFTAANPPVYETAVLNGLPSVRFNGTNQAMLFQLSLLFGQETVSLPQPLTIYLLANLRSLASGQATMFCLGNATSGVFTTFNIGELQINAGNSAGGPAFSRGAVHLMKVVLNGASSTISLDGGADSTVSPGTDGFSGFMSLGYDYTNNAFWSNLDFFCQMGFNYAIAHGSAQDVAIRGFINAKYGTSF